MAKSLKQKVTFSVQVSDAQTVQLAGDFTGWQESPVALRKAKDGRWQKTVSLSPGNYEYRLLVDGQWQDDPHCPARRPNPFGSQNCVLQVGANN